jgi:hypothetical protein
MLATSQNTAHHHKSENHNQQIHCHENLISEKETMLKKEHVLNDGCLQIHLILLGW